MPARPYLLAGAVALFLAAAVAANLLTATLGLVPVLPGVGFLMAAGTWAAGAALLARDAIHETADPYARPVIAAAIIAGAALSALGAPWRIAVASAVAFAVAELVDAVVYAWLRTRSRSAAVLVSTLVAAPIDTVLFLGIAGLGVTVPAVTGQWAAKLAVAALVAGTLAALRTRRRLLGSRPAL